MLSKIVSTIQDSTNAISAKCEHFFEFHHRSRTLIKLFIKKNLDSFINWTYGNLSYIFSNATVNSETVFFGFG